MLPFAVKKVETTISTTLLTIILLVWMKERSICSHQAAQQHWRSGRKWPRSKVEIFLRR